MEILNVTSHPPAQSFHTHWKRGLSLSALVLVLFSGLTWLSVIFKLDLRLAGLFFQNGGRWVFKDEQPWRMLYAYGTVPGLLLTLVCLVVFFLGFIKPRLRDYQKYMLVVVLTAILGAGILVNGILKPYCNRPRPREIKAFGGVMEYCLPCQIDGRSKGNAFPCGHCTMGFLFVSLFFCLKKSRFLALGGGAFGLLYGSLLGIARAAQGAHFFTDTLGALAAILITAVLVYDIILPLIERSLILSREMSRRQLWIYGVCLMLAAAAITTAFLTRRPYYIHMSRGLRISPEIQQVFIQANVEFTRRDILYTTSRPRVVILGQGFGWFNANEDIKIRYKLEGQRLTVSITANPHSYFSELHHEISLQLPPALENKVTVKFSPPKT